jgi:hypothetical protein
MTTLDDLRARYAAPTILKIDVEGFESEVLRGGGRVLSEDGPALLIELHPWADARAVHALLGGFQVAEVDPGHLLAVPALRRAQASNTSR